jgi:hypothetical protein
MEERRKEEKGSRRSRREEKGSRRGVGGKRRGVGGSRREEKGSRRSFSQLIPILIGWLSLRPLIFYLSGIPLLDCR